ncbi:MAG TPA: TAXI family TRAP transporter solute-binding subunit [Vicinamibacteria bacterium]|nr:TAXI family TRAP transporter solute-binding subunit [Vicinamibacteria bacterium]
MTKMLWPSIVLVSHLTACASPPPHDGSPRAEIAINCGMGTQYVQAAAVAAMVEKHTPLMAFVEPTKSHVAAMPLFQKGELDFIFVSQAEMALANRGEEYYESVGPTPIRVVAAGVEIMFAFFTSPRTGIARLEDLAGRKVMWDTKSSGVFYWAAKHVLDCYGLHDAIVSIPSPSPEDRAEALKAGRVDAYSCSTQYQAMEILHSSVGFEMLDIPEGCALEVNRKYPSVYPAVCPKGYNGGMVTRDVPVLAASTALHAHADLEDDVVYQVLEAIYDHFDEFAQAHPSLRDMSLDRAVALQSIVPYHPGAIRFYRDRGVWSDEAQAMQERLLDELSATE